MILIMCFNIKKIMIIVMTPHTCHCFIFLVHTERQTSRKRNIYIIIILFYKIDIENIDIKMD